MELKCKECQKEFATEEALNHHMQAKHLVEKKKDPFKFTKKHAILAIFVLAIVAVGGLAYTSITGPGPYDEFAQCITDSGAIFYGAFWCPHCSEQKAMFGKSIQYINYVECSTPDRRDQTPACKQANVESYPTWEFSDGSRLTGSISLRDLAAKTNCTL